MGGAGRGTRGTGGAAGRRTRRDGSSSTPAWRAAPTSACSTLATVMPGSTPDSGRSPASVRTVMFMMSVAKQSYCLLEDTPVLAGHVKVGRALQTS